MNFSFKRVLWGLWVALFPFLLILWVYPVENYMSRLAMLLVAFLIAIGSLFYSWRRPVLRWTLIGLYLLLPVILLLPSTSRGAPMVLRESYCKKLTSSTGIPYVWGGEGRLGLDCSGLVRKALVDTYIGYGVRTLNPYWMRQGLSLWWNDTTARVIGEGYFGRTRVVTSCRTLNSLDHSLLLPGDLAVTASGGHVMAYLGDKTWIGADPGEHRVTVFTIPENKDSYFSTPMKIVRWRALEDRAAAE